MATILLIIVFAWAIYKIIRQKAEPEAPPIDKWDEYMEDCAEWNIKDPQKVMEWHRQGKYTK